MTKLDVLVVGAGPTGLTMASELLRRGLSVRVIDKAEQPTKLSKALAVHARTLEIFDDFGIAEKLIKRGKPLHGATMFAAGEEIARVDFDDLDTHYPFALCVSQAETETVLHELLAHRGGTVDRGVELTSLTQDASGIVATVTDDRGDETTIEASWVIGCDGARSAVRKALGIAFEGHTYEETFLLADVRVAAALAPDRITTFFADDGVVACFPLPDGQFRLVVSVPEDQEASGDPTLEAIATVADRRAGRSFGASNPTWIAWFRIHCRQVDSYRIGRAFLAGDAAHIHSPAGGQGMNTGIQDAHNLAWKLALVHQGKGKEVLLESYAIERHAVARALLRATDAATKIGTLKGAVASAVRNHVARFVTSFEHVRQRVARQIAELVIRYDDSPIASESVRSTLVGRVGRAEAGETPTIASRIAFGGGPKPGARAPDGVVMRAGSTGAPRTDARVRLASVIDGRKFTLLLFDGRGGTAAGYETLMTIARAASLRWGDHLAIHIVTPREELPLEIPPHMSVLIDVAGELESRYGATTECVYLIRPDLYVGFRSQPADKDGLVAYFEKILK